MDSIRTLDLTSLRSYENTNKIPVPKWVLEKLEVCEDTECVDLVIQEIEASTNMSSMCKGKSVHLAKVRSKVIENERDSSE